MGGGEEGLFLVSVKGSYKSSVKPTRGRRPLIVRKGRGAMWRLEVVTKSL